MFGGKFPRGTTLYVIATGEKVVVLQSFPTTGAYREYLVEYQNGDIDNLHENELSPNQPHKSAA